MAALVLSLGAMVVPIVTVIEMRLVTPLILLNRTRKAHRLALCAAFYMLIIGLRRQILKILTAMATDADPDASADQEGEDGSDHHAGNIGEHDGTDGSGGGSDANATNPSSRFDGGAAMDEDDAGGCGGSSALSVDAGTIVQDAVLKTSGLAARAAAAKEVDVKRVDVGVAAAARQAGATDEASRRNKAVKDDVAADDADDADGGDD